MSDGSDVDVRFGAIEGGGEVAKDLGCVFGVCVECFGEHRGEFLGLDVALSEGMYHLCIFVGR